MRITFLVDNLPHPTLPLLTEHGLSLYIETDDFISGTSTSSVTEKETRILCDMGASGAYIKNAKALGIDLNACHWAFLSHAHADHTGGLGKWIAQYGHIPVYASHRIATDEYFSSRPKQAASLMHIGEESTKRLNDSTTKQQEFDSPISRLVDSPERSDLRYIGTDLNLFHGHTPWFKPIEQNTWLTPHIALVFPTCSNYPTPLGNKYLYTDELENLRNGDVLMTEGNNRLTPNSSLLTPNYICSSTNSKAELHAIRALDLCAAPGGKSTHLASLLGDDSLLISNEVMPQRAHILAENATKWGYGNMAVTNNRPADFGKLAGYFDLILTDVPCSGEGMFRKDEKAIEDWSPAYVLECAERQRSILTDVWPALKQNGLLIYSTCTFNKAENEDNIAWIAQELGAEILESRHFYFHTDQSEGLFMAALRKTAPTTQMRVKSKVESRKSKVESQCKVRAIEFIRIAEPQPDFMSEANKVKSQKLRVKNLFSPFSILHFLLNLPSNCNLRRLWLNFQINVQEFVCFLELCFACVTK